MRREIAGLDAKHVAAAVGQHILPAATAFVAECASLRAEQKPAKEY